MGIVAVFLSWADVVLYMRKLRLLGKLADTVHCMEGNNIIEGEKFCGSVGSEHFMDKTLAECKINYVHVGPMVATFVEKTFVGAYI